MTKREKIILTIMFLTIIWGGYVLFFDSKYTSSPKASAIDTIVQDKQIIQNLGSKLAQQKTSDIETYLIESAKNPWTKDPFLSSAENLHPKRLDNKKAKGKTTPAIANWVYSGYLEVEGKRLAIINGLEYEEGESLFPAGWYLSRVQKNHVIIAAIGKDTTFSLPLTEP